MLTSDIEVVIKSFIKQAAEQGKEIQVCSSTKFYGMVWYIIKDPKKAEIWHLNGTGFQLNGYNLIVG